MIDRRDFLRMIGVAGAGATLLGSSAILTSCSKKSESEKTSTSLNASGEFAAVRISSDLHNSELRQRIAFSVFDSKRKIAAQTVLNSKERPCLEFSFYPLKGTPRKR